MKKLIGIAIAVSVALVLMVTPATAATDVILCKVQIGNPTSEAGHEMKGWGPVELATSGGKWGGMGIPGDPEYGRNCRVIWSDNLPDDGGSSAKVVLDRCMRPGAATAIAIRHLDGLADDSFIVKVKDVHDH